MPQKPPFRLPIEFRCTRWERNCSILQSFLGVKSCKSSFFFCHANILSLRLHYYSKTEMRCFWVCFHCVYLRRSTPKRRLVSFGFAGSHTLFRMVRFFFCFFSDQKTAKKHHFKHIIWYYYTNLFLFILLFLCVCSLIHQTRTPKTF